ncbi:hypothetical protein ABZ619_28560 [Streptomyces sp. NPDC007851]|uniref:hypothetical protein n=1 Tax=Streptomyces sp. NPDC007851 TaxID=3155008 RepID=UPI0033DFB30A
MTGAGQRHIILAVDDQPVTHGWWAAEKTARERFDSRVDERGRVTCARITFADEAAGQELMAWQES